MFLIRVRAYPWLRSQTAIRYTLEDAIALSTDLKEMGYSCVQVVEIRPRELAARLSNELKTDTRSRQPSTNNEISKLYDSNTVYI